MAWTKLLTLLVLLSAYVTRSRGQKSVLVVGSLALLIVVDAYFVVTAMVQRSSFMAEMPVQLVYTGHYLAQVLNYFGLTGLCIGLLTSRPTTDASVMGEATPYTVRGF
ncbi:MAG TPA: hypothetical protein VFI31_30130 [Pirellulales bacterium]|nr:hypothetical protein [Pirellulales bacterium]